MLIKLGIFVVLLILVLTMFRKKKAAVNDQKEAIEPPVEMKQDHVCGSYVEETTRYKVRYYDKIYYFCSEECKDKFVALKKSENQ